MQVRSIFLYLQVGLVASLLHAQERVETYGTAVQLERLWLLDGQLLDPCMVTHRSGTAVYAQSERSKEWIFFSRLPDHLLIRLGEMQVYDERQAARAEKAQTEQKYAEGMVRYRQQWVTPYDRLNAIVNEPDVLAWYRNEATITSVSSRAMPSFLVARVQTAMLYELRQVVANVLAYGHLNQENLVALLEHHYQTLAARHLFSGDEGTAQSIYVTVYAAGRGPGEWLGVLSDYKPGLSAIVAINTRAVGGRERRQLDRQARIEDASQKLGEERRKIFMQLMEAYERAYVEALQLNPMSPGELERNTRALEEGYTAEVAREHGLSEQDMIDLGAEAMRQEWPSLPRKE